MADLKHILIATDGSEGARSAAAYAGALARRFEARVTVLCVLAEEAVVQSAWGLGGLGQPTPGELPVDAIRSKLEEHARVDQIDATVSAVGELKQAPDLAVVWGHPAVEICRYGQAHEVDHIVIGSHGRSGLGRLLLGSVSHAVVNQAPCPVTVVR